MQDVPWKGLPESPSAPEPPPARPVTKARVEWRLFLSRAESYERFLRSEEASAKIRVVVAVALHAAAMIALDTLDFWASLPAVLISTLALLLLVGFEYRLFHLRRSIYQEYRQRYPTELERVRGSQ